MATEYTEDEQASDQTSSELDDDEDTISRDTVPGLSHNQVD